MFLKLRDGVMSELGHRKTQEVLFESDTLVFTIEISARNSA